jgi:hypothetical protein
MNLNFRNEIFLEGQNIKPQKLKIYNKWKIKDKILNEIKFIKERKKDMKTF